MGEKIDWAKAVIPRDRTHKQPVTAFCQNPECIENGKRFEFKFEHADVVCPKCGACKAPYVGILALVHFLHKDPRGPIEGTGGIRYRLACDENRAYLATITNQEACTGELEYVNCPGCLTAAEKRKLEKQQGEKLVANLPDEDYKELSR